MLLTCFSGDKLSFIVILRGQNCTLWNSNYNSAPF
ncbi:hypothetical protein E2C01_036466 [Portunus trituberculatus]|uniref:Uncharacterized protein n=1 Tax=Portunus trituberculatus TaxID=210409 RepID=A0A5B7FBF8_PORTR|nr:hypothetical protein [Portunus trituberculatus]